MNTDEKQKLLLKTLGIELSLPGLSSLPEDLLALFLVVWFWSKHSPVTQAHVYSILLSRLDMFKVNLRNVNDLYLD